MSRGPLRAAPHTFSTNIPPRDLETSNLTHTWLTTDIAATLQRTAVQAVQLQILQSPQAIAHRPGPLPRISRSATSRWGTAIEEHRHTAADNSHSRVNICLFRTADTRHASASIQSLLYSTKPLFRPSATRLTLLTDATRLCTIFMFFVHDTRLYSWSCSSQTHSYALNVDVTCTFSPHARSRSRSSPVTGAQP